MSKLQKEPLSNKRIIQATLDILDSYGAAGLSMRRLGTTLNVEAASLYHHVPNKEALIQQVIDDVSIKAVVDEATVLPWTQTFHAFATNFRNILKAHPGVVPLVAIHSVSEETGAKLAVPLIAAMEKTKASPEEVLFIIQSIAVFVIGHALAEVGNWPERPTAPPEYYNQWFEVGLTALINGFKQKYE
ncbi:TetR/AcrR family transcriptional regulator [Lysinibacillus sp. NPDC059133]|uniref:TetR/AcrR family transcriptional regulator n=1 Tax=Lysinibacillus sp. NPDC059133 TaxID=3346737 RepID=UPI003691C3F3